MDMFFTQDNVFALLGGMGLFLFGIKLMGDSLKNLAGDSLRDLINKYTSNKFAAVFTGALATVAIQSSSGTSALTISLVRAGLMDLTQAIGVIMGANIGTTVTAFLLGLAIKDYALIFIFVGALIYMFSTVKKKSLIGQIIFGFGMLFFGMSVMDSPLKELAATPEFSGLMEQVAQTPLLGVLIGTVLTMLVQSSSATIGILQALYLQGMGFPIAFAILLGDNIGTTITSLLASIGGSRDSKRAALSHVVFNLFGTVIFFVVMFGFNGIEIYEQIIFKVTDNLPLQIAYSHLFFNFVVTAVLIWFIGSIEKIVRKLVPLADDEVKVNLKDQFLDETLINTSPSMALVQGEKAVIEMTKLVEQQLISARAYVKTDEKKNYVQVEQLEVGVNSIDKRLKVFFRDLGAAELSDSEMMKINAYMYSINDLERIADLSVNVVVKYKMFLEDKENLSNEAKEEIVKMLDISVSIVKDIIKLYETGEFVIAGKIFEKEKHLDKLERKYYKLHLNRVKANICRGKLSISYVDLLSDIERMGDHGQNIAEYYTNTNQVLSEEEEEFDLSVYIAD